MTLNITLLTVHTIFQSADYRLTTGTGARLSDASMKIITLQYEGWSGRDVYGCREIP